MTRPEPVYFACAGEFRDWLARHHASASELIVGFHKLDSGVPSMTWPESVDEALCYGWIDGVRKRIDDLRYQIRFTPRKAGSNWSAINIQKVADLTAAGRMQLPGLAAFAQRSEDKSRIYAYEKRPAELIEPYASLFRAHTEAWDLFQAQPPSYRRTLTWWVISAKQEATRHKRLRQLIDASAAGRRVE
jgi:uncharacterized protein YdeI (YjbR/CyaY-like superfamily)